MTDKPDPSPDPNSKAAPKGTPRPSRATVARLTPEQAAAKTKAYNEQKAYNKSGHRQTLAIEAGQKLRGDLETRIPRGFVSIKLGRDGIEVRVLPGFEKAVPKTVGENVPVIVFTVAGALTQQQLLAESAWWKNLARTSPGKLTDLGVVGFRKDSATGKWVVKVTKDTPQVRAAVQALRPKTPMLFEKGGPQKPASDPPAGPVLSEGVGRASTQPGEAASRVAQRPERVSTSGDGRGGSPA